MSLIIILIGLAADYVSKQWALGNLVNGETIHLIEGYLDFQYVENRGAAFGIFQGNVQILSVISLLIVAALLTFAIRSKIKGRLFLLAVSLIICGALGNIYDRLVYGFVVDFIHAHWQNVYHFPTFNVADMCVTIGTALMLIYIVWFEEADKPVDTKAVTEGNMKADTQVEAEAGGKAEAGKQ